MNIDPHSLCSAQKSDALSNAISNLVDATELAHDILSKKVESATTQGNEVTPDDLASLRLKLQELDLTSLIFKRSHEGADHAETAHSHRLRLTKAQYAQCLTHLLRVAYESVDVSGSSKSFLPG